MKKVGVVFGLLLMTLAVAACNTTNETSSQGETGTTDDKQGSASDDDAVKNDDESNDSDNEAEEQEYTEEEVTGDFLIYGEWLEGTDLVLYFTRTTDEMTREERFHQSLMESDPSQRELFSDTTKFEVDGKAANLYFDENDDLSMASTESSQFWEVLNEIGFRYGIEEFNLFNQDGERGLALAENHWEEPVKIEEEPNRGYYVMSPEESERGEYTYISGAVAEEEIYADDGELFDFGQTVEAMTTVKTDEDTYHSGIYDGLEIEEAMIDGNQAIVKYHIDDGVEASQQEREDFEQVLQLAALDFQVEALQLVNETDQVISTYPLLDETDDNNNTVADNDSQSEDQSGKKEQEELTEEDATGIAFDYVDEHEDYDREDVKAMVDRDEDGKFIVRIFVYSGGEDDTQMMNTIGWYQVDKETGEITERDL
ncbi:hypothetical protein J14TS2_38840 [Bacillus sp. J14TS2]|uniref:hypothetical protein n=1 Tax=Bacillus sp. J14TS2 TaxID=2807188 RepID=UPI001B0B1642|nr:hypothetical protein [Bacillus sp. J14TS2]GIN73409.1 hypothetical protein J14TS2_38840 [Bacillus sp. J14TS2]